MNFLQIIISIVGTIISLAALFAGIGYFRQGKKQGEMDTVTLFKDQIDALEGKVNLQSEQISKQDTEIKNLTNEIQILRKEITEKDKKLIETLEILQGRDPRMQEFISELKAYIELGRPALETLTTKIIPIVNRLDKFLDKQILWFYNTQ